MTKTGVVRDSSQWRGGRIPLAEQLRPQRWEDIILGGAIDRELLIAVGRGEMARSLILCGPPGCGKTTVAQLLLDGYPGRVVRLSAVHAGVKELREVCDVDRREYGATLLFVDEIHRFSKTQQDALLPAVEAGSVTLVGATTENPSFSLTSALLSRCKLVRLPPLGDEELMAVWARACRFLSAESDNGVAELVINAAGGDARRLLGIIDELSLGGTRRRFTREDAVSLLNNSSALAYDRDGDEHYTQISAFIKSLRGSDPDAALYWGFRILEGGEDPRFVLRRMIVFASEDVGNADPRALQLAVATMGAYEVVGLPEGRIPIAQCITYLATAPKSDKSYLAMKDALDAVRRSPRAAVPPHLTPSGGARYVSPHASEAGVVRQQYLPNGETEAQFYNPGDAGYERTIAERLRYFRSMQRGGSTLLKEAPKVV